MAKLIEKYALVVREMTLVGTGVWYSIGGGHKREHTKRKTLAWSWQNILVSFARMAEGWEEG